MIWLVFLIMTALVVLFLAPVFFGETRVPTDAELSDYFSQIDAVRADDNLSPDEAQAAITQLERQILERQEATSAKPSRMISLAILMSIGLGGALIYNHVGRPDLVGTVPTAEPDRPETSAEDPSIDTLIEQLENRLQTDRANDPAGWVLYARTLMNLGRFDEALQAYDRVIALTENDPVMIAERDRAQAIISGVDQPSEMSEPSDSAPMRGPTAQDIQDASELSEAERQQMIQGMVDGLAARLETDPDDPMGWSRLIRARMVLGQTDLATEHVADVRQLFADSPETITQILSNAGWSDDPETETVTE